MKYNNKGKIYTIHQDASLEHIPNLSEAVKLTLALGLSSTFPHVLIIWHRHSRSSAKSAIGRRRRFSNNWGV